MENSQTQKQWWAPVWKGLVMDAEAKHHRMMKSAVWLYLYLLLGANRKTGILMRKIETISKDMGIPRDAVSRWLNVLRDGGYIVTTNTGRSLTIQVTRWKALAGAGKTKPQMLELSNTRYWKIPPPSQMPVPAIPLGKEANSGAGATGNDTKIQINVFNDPRNDVARQPTSNGFTGIGVFAQQEWLAQELVRSLNDAGGIKLYRSYAAKYPEWLLRKVLGEVEAMPLARITKSRGALFNYLVQHYENGATQNSGH